MLVATSDLPERYTGISVSFIARPAYWGSTVLHRTKGLASAASSHLGGEDAVFRAQFIEGASVQAEQKC